MKKCRKVFGQKSARLAAGRVTIVANAWTIVTGRWTIVAKGGALLQKYLQLIDFQTKTAITFFPAVRLAYGRRLL